MGPRLLESVANGEPPTMKTNSIRSLGSRVHAATTPAMLFASFFAAGCSQSATYAPGDSPQGGDPSVNDAGSLPSSDAGGVIALDASPPGKSDDAGAPATPDTGAGPGHEPDAAPAAQCGTTTSISAILAKYGSDSTASTVTPMGTRFESAAKAGAISAANAALLSTASSNADVAQATSATGLGWQKVAVKLYPSGTPSPEDIMQHAIGDCDGDSAMASMAYVNPAFVQSLIKDNGDGTYTIAMFDPMGKPITVVVDSTVLVDSGDATNIGQVTAADGSADWATILEKAVMKYDAAYGMVGQIDGIGSEQIIPMFTGTGGSIAISPGSLTPAQFQQVVTVSLAAGQFITGGFNQELALGQDETVTAHGYAVMVPTDPSTDMSDMRNPWGVSPWASSSSSGNNGYDTSTDGVLHIPLATAPTDWTQIIDLRIIDPGPQCAGVTTPFAPKIAKPGSVPIQIHERHARRAPR